MSRFRPSILCVAALSAAVFSFHGWQEIQGLAEIHSTDKNNCQDMKTTWTTSTPSGGSMEHTVETERIDGEKTEDWAARHKDAVDALQVLYPPA